MKQDSPQVGKLVEGKAFRDCIHVAVAPVAAGEALSPGDHVRLRGEDGAAMFTRSGDERAVGVVDPFLRQVVGNGETFWLFVLPNTVTSLRHAWSHKAFEAKTPQSKEAGGE